MKNFTKKISTATIYGHTSHVHLAERALAANVITRPEFDILRGAYSHCIFTGRSMSEKLSDAGNAINLKVHLFLLQIENSVLLETLIAAFAGIINRPTYEISIFFGKDNSIEVLQEKSTLSKDYDGRHKYNAFYSIIDGVLNIDYELVA